jgi:hypothetical protein
VSIAPYRILKALTDHLGGGREYTHSIRTGKLEGRMNFFSYFKGPLSRDQQKTIWRRLITFKVTLTGQSHLMLIFVLRKVTLPIHINSVPWINGITPTPYHECTQLVQKILWLNWMKVTWRSRQTAYIHGTELVWPRSFMVRSWCDCVKSWYGVDVTACIQGTEFLCTLYSVHCTVVIHLADFLKQNIKKSANFNA